ncbi:MAG: hypothetical protein ING25_11090 [Burkholderiales bacterium]|nr:hypothetical protein [Burkholderiales bacterium]
MLQREMFTNAKHGELLGSGVYSSAFRLSNGLVMKHGRNDGTRNWLEFCMLEREAGRLMPLMPEVYQVVSIEGERYMAVMPEYVRVVPTDWVGEPDTAESAYAGFNVFDHPDFEEVCSRFRQYMKQFEGFNSFDSNYDLMNDTHTGNVMLCHTRGVVITDPCCWDYYSTMIAVDLELTHTVH